MSIKTIYALTICAVLLFMPTVSAQTEGAGDEVLFLRARAQKTFPRHGDCATMCSRIGGMHCTSACRLM